MNNFQSCLCAVCVCGPEMRHLMHVIQYGVIEEIFIFLFDDTQTSDSRESMFC